ncbi:MAG: hypothetical protein ACI4EQ_08220 [Lachnospiraceae bacterium]
MKKWIISMTVILMAAMVSGCSKDNLADNDMENTIVKDTDEYEMDPDYYEYPKVDKNEQLKNNFERVEGIWRADDKTVEFYIEDELYRFNDYEYNQNSPIGELTISEDGKLTMIVGGGDMQVRIEGSISEDNSKLILEDTEYTFVGAETD